ncbi:MAG: hypothetical protein ABI559_12045 [Chloroflexota bacterium]
MATTQTIRHPGTIARPQRRGFLHNLPGVILSVAIMGATAAGAVYIGTHKTEVTSNSGDAPSDLVAVRDALPRFEGMTDYQPAVYNGGTSMDALYFSNENSQDVANFYDQQMVKAGWKVADAPHVIIAGANPNKTVNPGWEFKATKDNFTVTVSAVDSDAGLTGGTTQHTVHIERN